MWTTWRLPKNKSAKKKIYTFITIMWPVFKWIRHLIDVSSSQNLSNDTGCQTRAGHRIRH